MTRSKGLVVAVVPLQEMYEVRRFALICAISQGAHIRFDETIR